MLILLEIHTSHTSTTYQVYWKNLFWKYFNISTLWHSDNILLLKMLYLTQHSWLWLRHLLSMWEVCGGFCSKPLLFLNWEECLGMTWSNVIAAERAIVWCIWGQDKRVWLFCLKKASLFISILNIGCHMSFESAHKGLSMCLIISFYF